MKRINAAAAAKRERRGERKCVAHRRRRKRSLFQSPKSFAHSAARHNFFASAPEKIFIALLLAFMLNACTRSANQQPRAPETGGAVSASETTETQAEARVPTAAEAQALLALQERIMQQPQEVALRRALGQKAIDANAGVVWSMGRAKISTVAASPNVAQSQAELAARIDASRWAAYLRAWHTSDYAADFGAIQMQVPGGEVVSKTVTDSICVVLLKTSLR